MKNKTNVNEISRTFRLLYYWGKLIGINPLALSKDNQLKFSYTSLVYGCFLGAIYCYIFYRALLGRLMLHVPGETSVAVIVDFIGIICQFLEIFLTWMVSALSRNSTNCIVNDFIEIEKILARLGFPDRRDKALREFGISVLFNNILYLASLAFSTICMASFSGYQIIVWSSFNLPRLSSFNMTILFVWSLHVVKQTFRRVNESVRLLSQNHRSRSTMETRQLTSGLITVSR